MNLEMVFNELSLRSPSSDILTARGLMSDLIQTLRKATQSGISRTLRTSGEINFLELAPNYPVSRWRNDPEVDREEQRFFRTLQNKAPLWVDIAEEIKDSFDLSDVWYQEDLAQGLGFALLMDGLAISFNSDARWDNECLEIKVRRLDEAGELIDEIEEVKHASQINHITVHAEWIKQRIQTNIKDGLDIWNRKEELFPHLSFCESVQGQLQNLNDEHPMLQLIKKKLVQLEEYSKNWSEGAFDPDCLGNTSPESQITLQTEKYQRERTFLCPDGENRLFNWHLKLSNWRIYYFPQSAGEKIIIGYIGLHLRTVKYSN